MGPVGAWEVAEHIVEGVRSNPPFEKCFLQNIVNVFDSGVRDTAVYCCCVLLPLVESHGIVQRTTELASQRILLVRIPLVCFSFGRQERYFVPQCMTQYNGSQ